MGQAAECDLADNTFAKERRLLTAADYSRVFNDAQARASHRHLLILATPNGLPWHRLGLVVAKKHVRSAVDRNQVKRIAREVFRIQPGGAVPLDVVVLARRGIDQLNKQQLMTILRQQWLKLSSHASSLESGNDRGR